MNVMKAGYEILTPISEGGKEELQMIDSYDKSMLCWNVWPPSGRPRSKTSLWT